MTFNKIDEVCQRLDVVCQVRQASALSCQMEQLLLLFLGNNEATISPGLLEMHHVPDDIDWAMKLTG